MGKVIGGVAAIPHDAIDSFIERALLRVDNPTITRDSLNAYLDDALTNLKQVRAEYDMLKAERDRMHPVVEAALDCWSTMCRDNADIRLYDAVQAYRKGAP